MLPSISPAAFEDNRLITPHASIYDSSIPPTVARP
jgi:hypothetical protein